MSNIIRYQDVICDSTRGPLLFIVLFRLINTDYLPWLQVGRCRVWGEFVLAPASPPWL